MRRRSKRTISGFPLGACLAVRRDVIDQVGLLDEAYGMYMEELDFCARIWAAGYTVRILPTVAVTHHGGQSTGQALEAMFLALHRARRRFYARHRPVWWNTGARWLTRVGLIVLTVQSLVASRQGKLAWDECRLQARMYGRAWHIWTQD